MRTEIMRHRGALIARHRKDVGEPAPAEDHVVRGALGGGDGVAGVDFGCADGGYVRAGGGEGGVEL